MNDNLNDIRQIVILTRYYSFDLGGFPIGELIYKWSRLYPHYWLSLAIIEAIYQGRLKAVSVEQILSIWHKKGSAVYSFNYEFIRLIQPDSLFKQAQEKDIQDIFMREQKQVKSMEKPPLHSTKDNLSSTRSRSNHRTVHQSVTSKDKLNSFQPLDDHSSCFQKLRSLANK